MQLFCVRLGPKTRPVPAGCRLRSGRRAPGSVVNALGEGVPLDLAVWFHRAQVSLGFALQQTEGFCTRKLIEPGTLHHARNHGVAHGSLTADSIWIAPDHIVKVDGFEVSASSAEAKAGDAGRT